MKKFVVSYVAKPTAFNQKRSLVVEAASPESAILLIKHHLLDLAVFPNSTIPDEQYVYTVSDYIPPPSGRILKLPPSEAGRSGSFKST